MADPSTSPRPERRAGVSKDSQEGVMFFAAVRHSLHEKAMFEMGDIHGNSWLAAKTKRADPVFVRPLYKTLKVRATR
jgi:hypothetical protein